MAIVINRTSFCF